MLEFLNRPYLFSYQPSRRIKQLLPFGISVFVFLVLVKPFGLSNNPNYVQFSAFISLWGTVTGLFTTVLIPYLFPAFFDESKWTIRRNMIWSISGNFIFVTLMFLGFNLYGICIHHHASWYYTLNAYLWWVSIQILFFYPLGMIINFLNQYYLLKKHLKIAERINTSAAINKQQRSVQQLEFEVDKFKKLRIDVHTLIYVEALDNYITIVYDNGGIRKITIRETIANIEQKIADLDIIYRPHRSYLVNLQNIERVTGDSQGLKIHLKGLDKIIPVSRNKIKEFRRHVTAHV
jgi:hypothetical protein